MRDLPDRNLCLVRTLKFYVDRTKDPAFRCGRKRLFVSIVEGFEREIRPATVARWIVSTIQLAYSLTNTSPDLRRLASVTMRCMLCLPPGQPIRESPSGTCSKQRRGVTTPRSLSSICGTVPFWLTACSQSVQSSQPSTWCDRGRKVSPFYGAFPFVRSFSVAVVVPPLSLELRRGPVGPSWPSVSLAPLPKPGGSFELPRTAPVGGRGPVTLSVFGSLVTLLRECVPAKHLCGCCCSTRWMISSGLS
jgi:hypothetical protein